MHGEDGQVWSWVLTLVLVAVVIGAIITQFFPIIWNHISVHATADDAADEAAMEFRASRGNMQRVNESVKDMLASRDARLVGSISFIKGENGEPDRIGLTVRKITNTYLFENIGYLCRLTEATAYSEREVP